jgi:hypothetical protein
MQRRGASNRRSNLQGVFIMSFAVTAMAPRLNPDVFAKLPVHEVSKFPPSPPDPTTIAPKEVGTPSLRQLADGWCGTVPRHLPFPPPKIGSDDGDWCGTVPHRLPHVPPPPPQPWLDLAGAAQSFR